MKARAHPSHSGCAHSTPGDRSEEHTSELQSHSDLVCRLLLEKKKQPDMTTQELRHHYLKHDEPRRESALSLAEGQKRTFLDKGRSNSTLFALNLSSGCCMVRA